MAVATAAAVTVGSINDMIVGGFDCAGGKEGVPIARPHDMMICGSNPIPTTIRFWMLPGHHGIRNVERKLPDQVITCP